MNKKALSERDICTQYITPAVQQAGWDLSRQPVVAGMTQQILTVCRLLYLSRHQAIP